MVRLKMSLETRELLSPALACTQSPLGQEVGGVPIVQCGRRGLGKRFGRRPFRTHYWVEECKMSCGDLEEESCKGV